MGTGRIGRPGTLTFCFPSPPKVMHAGAVSTHERGGQDGARPSRAAPRWRRWRWPIVIGLVLGVITNLALAIGLPWHALRRGWIDPSKAGTGEAVLLPGGKPRGYELARGWRHWMLESWSVYNPARRYEPAPVAPTAPDGLPGFVVVPWGPMAPPGLAEPMGTDPDRLDRSPRVSRVVTLASGWPFRAATGWVWEIDERPASAALHLREIPVGVVVLRPGARWGMYAPLAPMWGGVICNSVLFAAAWAGLIGAFAAMARRAVVARHARRGCCRSCGYDRRGLYPNAPCPECGRAPQPN